MSILRSEAHENAVAILVSSHPPRLRCRGRGIRDLRHCLDTRSYRDNERAPAPFRTAAKTRGQATSPVVLVRADQSALEQGGEDLA